MQVEQINALEPKMQNISDVELRDKTAEFKKRLQNGESLDDILVEAFAVILDLTLDRCTPCISIDPFPAEQTSRSNDTIEPQLLHIYL